MLKKAASLVLALCLTLSLTVTVSAAGSMEHFYKSASYASGQFRDVPAGAWYEESLKSCFECGLMNGTAATAFSPAVSLTRAQALVMAVRVHMIYQDGKAELDSGTPWYQPALDYALEQGMVKAEDFSDYDADATRGEMAYLFAKALPESELKAINTVTTLPDVTGSAPYSDAILRLYRAGVLNGSDIYGTFKPAAGITRAEACAIIARVAFPEQRKNLELFKASELALSDKGISANDDGYAEGTLGDVMRTYFFDYKITSAYTCAALNGYQPTSGNQLLVVRIVMKNTDAHGSIPMFDTDFMVEWGDGEEDYAFPLGNTALINSQLPASYELALKETRAGVLVFEVPAGSRAFTISYLELFDDDTIGDIFFTDFVANQK